MTTTSGSIFVPLYKSICFISLGTIDTGGTSCISPFESTMNTYANRCRVPYSPVLFLTPILRNNRFKSVNNFSFWSFSVIMNDGIPILWDISDFIGRLTP